VLLLDDRTGPEHRDLQLHSISHGVITLEKLPREYGVTRRRMEVVKLRGACFREGFHDYSIRTGGVVVYPRLVAAEHQPGFERSMLKSGVAELDELIGGGIDRGTSTLLVGPAGCGKSTIALRFALTAAENGERASIYTFEEGAGTLITRAESLGMRLRSQLETGRIALEQIDPAEMSPGQFVQKVRDAVVHGGARVAVIDSLNGFMQSMPGENFLAIQMHELLAFLNQHGVVTLMVLAQSGLMGNAQNPVDVSYLADNILLLRYFEASGAVKQAISILKKRSGGHEHTIRELRLGNGVQVGKPLDQFQGVLTGVPLFLGGMQTQPTPLGD
jgi:circadian clock protein KaiC